MKVHLLRELFNVMGFVSLADGKSIRSVFIDRGENPFIKIWSKGFAYILLYDEEGTLKTLHWRILMYGIPFFVRVIDTVWLSLFAACYSAFLFVTGVWAVAGWLLR
jgi:hypothetical protein